MPARFLLVNVIVDRDGHLILTPINRTFQVAVDTYLKGFGVESRGGALLIKKKADIDEFIADLNPKARRAVQRGWGATVKLEPQEFLEAIGYDAEKNVVQTDYGTWQAR